MLELQRTIEKPVSISGMGLHTGTSCTMTFKPAPDNSGIKFIRIDLGGKPEIPANADYVVDISRGTTLGLGDAKVFTVEHVLAAVVGLQIDNLVIELDGMEPPIGDGSSLQYVEKLLEAGFVTQGTPKDYLVIDQTVEYHNEKEKVDIVALPLDGFRISIMVDYENPSLGSQHSGLFDLEKEFISEFAPARTFCFLSEVEMLIDQGLIKGGNIDSAVVIIDHDINEEELKRLKDKLNLKHDLKVFNGYLNNNKLRFKNEPARHKILDMIGDLALIGVPIKAQVLAARPGHKANVEFAKKIRQLYHQKKFVRKYQFVKKEGIVFDVNAIERILPHRYPFLLVDKIIHLELDKKVVGIKNVTRNEHFFNGHFPGQPVMPGVLQIEAMAQVSGILLISSFLDPENHLVYFMSINNAKFRKPVLPGDQLVLEAELISVKSKKYYSVKGTALVDGNVVSEAEFMAAVVPKENKNNNK
ncbi:MAG: bifunctional UDP-3-O-[3-hydroxymyristoyl] N-acetylglucosamine deacetylase/3-hydroxyacyl-ACP dehydratase [Ignavibacteriales bacterium]|nr:bifunctional UDP-3-O-[3-hydroxymyristoyl] N-acetylglucosamine deacetylase/3-hydroxyacyl-ACP dehydratase [Ignavibacteriales bacterium]